MIRASIFALAVLSIATPALAKVDHPHKWYRDRDIPVITAVLKSQLDSPDFMPTGLASFSIEPQGKFPDGTVDPEDSSHDVIDAYMTPGNGAFSGGAQAACEALRKLYWGSAFWVMIGHGVIDGKPAQVKCDF